MGECFLWPLSLHISRTFMIYSHLRVSVERHGGAEVPKLRIADDNRVTHHDPFHVLFFIVRTSYIIGASMQVSFPL